MVIILIIALLFSFSYAGNLKLEINLNKKWNFIIGDDPDYADPGYEDSDWEKIKVSDAWENCGYPAIWSRQDRRRSKEKGRFLSHFCTGYERNRLQGILQL